MRRVGWWVLACWLGGCARTPAEPSNPPDPGLEPGADQGSVALPAAPMALSPEAIVKASAPSPGMLAAEIVDLLFVPATLDSPAGVVALLRHPPEPERLLPIYIGDREGEAIARRMMNEPFIRPLTHDLLEKVLERRDLKVLKLEIDALQDGTYLAQLYLLDMREGTVMMLDARPSDGMVLATGAEAPIYVSRQVLDTAGEPYERWREFLERDETPAD